MFCPDFVAAGVDDEVAYSETTTRKISAMPKMAAQDLAAGHRFPSRHGTGNVLSYSCANHQSHCNHIETGFYYLQSRYYDPGTGRFINADSFASTGQGFLGYNMFAYCRNSAVNMDDQSGELPAGVKPMQVAINDCMPSSDGPSATSCGKDIPAEYGGDVVENAKDVAATMTNMVKIYSGIKNIGKGFGMVCAPIPTPIDELVGLGFVVYGSFQVVIGFGKVIFGGR